MPQIPKMSTKKRLNGRPKRLPRFSWPMRIFLGLFVFCMVFRSLAALSDYPDWLDKLKMRRFPKPLPTWTEIENEEAAKTRQRASEACTSFCEYWKPWPDEKTSERIESWSDGGKFIVAWLGSRMELLENTLGLRQEWTMFSPSIATSRTMSRARLEYEDGSLQVVRLASDPAEPTNFTHSFSTYRKMSYETTILDDSGMRQGYCNYLRHRFAENESGSPLRAIYIYEIKYRCPAPGEDAWSVWNTQAGPPEWQKKGPSYAFDERTGELRKLSDDERLRIEERLTLTDGNLQTATD